MGASQRRENDERRISVKVRKEDRIVPVITIVFYYGEEKWDGSLELYEMFPEELRENEELLQKYIVNYRINLLDAGHLEQTKSFKTDLHEICGMLECRKTKAELLQYVRRNENYFRNVDEDTYYVIREFLHSEQIWKKEIKLKNGKEQVNMCKALEELYHDGIDEGIAVGKKEQLLEKIRIKLAKGKSAEEIAEALEEDLLTIQKLILELN